jgi:universal stress protein A
MLPIRTILHPTDFSECSEFAFRVACSMARDYRARLIILHVAPSELVSSRVIGGSSPETYRAELENRLRRCEMPDLRIVVEHQLRQGEPAVEILRAVQEFSCDLIVLGTHGRTGLGRALLGSVAESVMRNATCPVLTVKAPSAEPTTPADGSSHRDAIIF